jgi:ABC-type uncharacterized transport system substrate-binding protein
MNLNKYLLIIFIYIPFIFAQDQVNLLAVMPVDGHYADVLSGMRSELRTKYKITVIDANQQNKALDVVSRCKKENIKALILMDSRAIDLAVEMQKLDSLVIAMPKFVLMTLKAEETNATLANVTGIKFEVPGFTLITNFHIISQKDFTKVGVFYRKEFESSVETAKKLLAKEKITLVAKCLDYDAKNHLSTKSALATMKSSFDEMVKKDKVEVFWMILDNAIVNKESLEQFWLTKVRNKRMPVIAPLETLADPSIGAAMFTADPDFIQLGVQAANQIFLVFEDETPVNDIGFESTISIKTTLNLDIANKLGWSIKQEKLIRVSKIIKK